LRDLDGTIPIQIIGAGYDYVEGVFLERPGRTEAVEIARRVYRFAPEVVVQGPGDVESLADELEQGRFFLWWD
jgi:hypothetical protein